MIQVGDFRIGKKEKKAIMDVLDKLISLSDFSGKIKIKVDKKRLRPNDSFSPKLNISKFVRATG